MRTTYCTETDAAYITMVDSVEPGEAVITRSVQGKFADTISLDFDQFGKILGIEVLYASVHVPDLITEAQQI